MCANRSPIRSRIASEYSRRRVLTAVGVVAGGGATLAVAPEDASADVAVEDFAVSDATFEAESVTPVVDARTQRSAAQRRSSGLSRGRGRYFFAAGTCQNVSVVKRPGGY